MGCTTTWCAAQCECIPLVSTWKKIYCAPYFYVWSSNTQKCTMPGGGPLLWSVGAKLSVGFYSTPSTKQNKLLQHNPRIGITHTHTSFFSVAGLRYSVHWEIYRHQTQTNKLLRYTTTSSIFWECWLIQWHAKTAFENNKHKKTEGNTK